MASAKAAEAAAAQPREKETEIRARAEIAGKHASHSVPQLERQILTQSIFFLEATEGVSIHVLGSYRDVLRGDPRLREISAWPYLAVA